MRGEEVGGDPAQRRLLGDGLGAVLAELGGVPLVALGPGAARAVEAVLLVDLEQGAARCGARPSAAGRCAGCAPMAGSPAAACLGRSTCGASWTGSPVGRLGWPSRSPSSRLAAVCGLSPAMPTSILSRGAGAPVPGRGVRSGLSVGRGRIGGVAETASKKTADRTDRACSSWTGTPWRTGRSSRCPRRISRPRPGQPTNADLRLRVDAGEHAARRGAHALRGGVRRVPQDLALAGVPRVQGEPLQDPRRVQGAGRADRRAARRDARRRGSRSTASRRTTSSPRSPRRPRPPASRC